MDNIVNRDEIIKRNRVFVLVMVPLICLFLYFLFSPSIAFLSGQENILWERGDWLLSDFFYTLLNIKDGDPYGNKEIYMPLCYLILYPFSLIGDYSPYDSSDDYASLQNCWNNPQGIVSYMYLLIIMSLLFWHSLQKINKNRNLSSLTLVSLFFSCIFIFSIERGNLIFLSAACVNYFLAFYQDEDKKKNRIALVALCIATILKIYPILFGLLLLKERRYKDICFCIVIGVPLAILPYFAFKNGLSNIPIHMANIALNNDYVADKWYHMWGLDNVTKMFCYFLGFPKVASALHLPVISQEIQNILLTISRIITIILSIVSVLLALVNKVPAWKCVALLTCVLILLPANSGFYCGLYLMASFCMMIGGQKINVLYILLSCIIFNPLQIIVLDDFSISCILSNLAMVALWLLLLLSSVKDVIIPSMRRTITDPIDTEERYVYDISGISTVDGVKGISTEDN